jgi:hypothetical protein
MTSITKKEDDREIKKGSFAASFFLEQDGFTDIMPLCGFLKVF